MNTECGDFLAESLSDAIKDGSVSVDLLKETLYNLTLVQFRLGMFDNPKNLPWYHYNESYVNSNEHQMISLSAARQGIVVLKNMIHPVFNTSSLPINLSNSIDIDFSARKSNYKHLGKTNDDNDTKHTIGIIGPNGDSKTVMTGNYHGHAPFIYSIKDGVEEYLSSESDSIKSQWQVKYELGCLISDNTTQFFENAINLAIESDIILLTMGIDQTIEKEGHDRNNINLPYIQHKLITNILDTLNNNGLNNKIIVLIILSGGCVDISQYGSYNTNTNSKMMTSPTGDDDDVDVDVDINTNATINGIIWGGYGGMWGGKAIADIIFGEFNPVGRLTQTWYTGDYINQVSMFDMGMRPNETTNNAGRGYRYYDGDNINFPFGYGLSYTTFKCSDIDDSSVNNNGQLSISVVNNGQVSSGGVVLIFWVPEKAGQNGIELKRLVAFDQFEMLQSNQTTKITMNVYNEFLYSQEFKVNEGSFVASGACD